MKTALLTSTILKTSHHINFDNIKILDADDNMIRRRFLELAYSIGNDNSYNRHFQLPEIYRPLLREYCRSN